MTISFGPVAFEPRFDPALDPDRLEAFVRASAPPPSLRYGPWPCGARRTLEVVLGSTPLGSASPRYREDAGSLSFIARGAIARLDAKSCILTLNPSLQPGERMDQLVLTLAAAGVAAMLEEDLGVVLHASTSAQEGRAWTFPAPHATGKSTVANRLDPDLKISDDLTALVPGRDGDWRAGGVNATGTGTLPLGALLFLRRGVVTEVGPVLETPDALRHLIRNAVLFPGAPTLAARLMDRLAGIAETVPCRLMDFSLTDLDQAHFRRLLWRTM